MAITKNQLRQLIDETEAEMNVKMQEVVALRDAVDEAQVAYNVKSKELDEVVSTHSSLKQTMKTLFKQ